MNVNNLKIDVQGMREKILELAMRGKLVNQDKNDESASVLLEKIAQEKEQLIKEMKIKKTKPLPEITDEEKPFDIPDSWEWVRLGEIVLSTIGGGTPAKNISEYWNGNLPWISIKDIHDKEYYINSSLDTITQDGLRNSSTNLIKKGSLIVAMRMAVGRIAILKVDACINQDLRALNISENFNKYFLLHIYSSLNLKTSGSTVKGIKLGALLNTIIPLPPLNEQKRIAAKVEELFELLDIIEESTNNYENLQKELKEKILELGMQGKLVKQDSNDEPADKLYEQIQAEKTQLIKEKKIKKSKPLPEITDEEKPFDIPNSWKWVRLGEVSEIKMGQAPKGITVNEEEIGNEFHQGKTEFTNKIIGKSEKFTTQNNKLVNQNYILMAVRAPVGDVNLLDRTVFIGRGLAGVKAYLSSRNYFYYYLKTKKTYYNKLSTGSTFKAINGDVIKNTPISLPPLNEQKRIATKIEELFTTIDSQN